MKRQNRFSVSSRRWLSRAQRDIYGVRGQSLGFRSRAAAKLLWLDKACGLLRAGQCLLDLGAAPGGWSGVALRHKGMRVIGVDTHDVAPMAGLQMLRGDVRDRHLLAVIRQAAGEGVLFDGVLADIAPPSSGHKALDHQRQIILARHAFLLALFLLKQNGFFLCKVYQGAESERLFARLCHHFYGCRRLKPPSSRAESVEFYVVGRLRRCRTVGVA
ncbi:MAG: RlmE family RNA methyltransferase [Alphaproteobacteria bacterium GM202ARS2]|nr:RlmE family RNA methyltransferase [Alphaproteobacteria bacterium GM202ARS2]